MISKPIKSESHSSSLSALANDDDAVDEVAAVVLGLAFSVVSNGDAASFATCGSLPLAVATLSVSGASAASTMGESTLDFRRTPWASELDNKMISRKFIDFGSIVVVCFYTFRLERKQ